MVNSFIAIVPAKGKSTRIKNKNLKPFLGTPILERQIERLTALPGLEAILVSSEASEVLRTVETFNKCIPISRPLQLAEQTTPTRLVVNHAEEYWLNNGGKSDVDVLTTYPTSITSTLDQIRLGQEKLSSDSDSFVLSACRYSHPPQRGFREIKHGYVAPISPESIEKPTQLFPKIYFDAGQFYWSKLGGWQIDHQNEMGNRQVVELPPWNAVDIDEPEDWRFAEMIFQALTF